ncbi:helix-turn-helix transcriptional regulator [Paenibacillus beijingensis]|uniref:AraC family transcriptional regulator n=1 Tax=Paenibacillus beijingensis TaxID=1126833 RepID=A0A0D5NNZ1_9BACL|nr:AraC family transcriptional regulator [Paenibacillus beijingensis]AJY76991.1 AraC family transcriptional regulator [Paenibacillus beijingensis]
MLAINLEHVPKIKLLGYVSYKNPWIHFKRNTDEYILYFIKSGELHLHENGTPYRLMKGDVLLLEPQLEHEGLEKHPCDYFFIHFQHRDIRPLQIDDVLPLAKHVIFESIPSPLPQDASGLSDVCYFPKYYRYTNKNNLHHALHDMNELLQLNRRKQYNRSLTALKFAEWMIGVSRENLISELQHNDKRSTRSFMKVNELLDYIHQNYPDKITGSAIETKFECNYDYINRIFHEVTGYPITRYVNLVRINHAKELIEATHLSMNEIGYLTGLNDPYYFSKVFKKYVGLSPSQYDKKVREEAQHLP